MSNNHLAATAVGVGFLFLMGAAFATLALGANIDALHEYSGQMLRSASEGTTLYPFQDRYLGTGLAGLFAPMIFAGIGVFLIMLGFQNLSPDKDD
ncbi:MAG TPA: hypothetical protein VNU25_01135 [Candidatus Paceibacterota bacterium]|nr:hypothetical protein [Candidatus Paceibacterota bacterium]